MGTVAQWNWSGVDSYGQARISNVVYDWLRYLDMTVGHLTSRGDIIRVTGVDEKLKNTIWWNRWVAIVGWALFILGITLQMAAA